MGGVIWLHLRISRAKWKHFMIDKTRQVCYRKPYYPLTNGHILYDQQNTQVCYRKPYDPLTPTHIHALVDSGIGTKEDIFT